MTDNKTKLSSLLNNFCENLIMIQFFSEKTNLSDLNCINKDISLIFQNLESATEIVFIFNL